jgi:hypothetical protein
LPVPPPEPGLVIRYNYLWRRDAEAGHARAKARPACIVAAIEPREAEPIRVVIIPITHSDPADTAAIEIPQKVKRHLGLDDERSWVVLNECNIDIWPSPDLSIAPEGQRPFDYGFLPPRFFEEIRSKFHELLTRGKLARTQR